TGPLTEGFDFNTTPSNSSNTVFDMDNSTWADEGEPPIKNEYWTLKVVEQPVTYFLVRRKGAYGDLVQTITVGGPAASLVTQYGPGFWFDGSDLYGEDDGYCYAGFEVRTDDFDMMFDGGKKYFTLKISEEGHASVTVHVTIVSAPDLSVGTAVFRVSRTLAAVGINDGMSAAQAENWARSGTLERIPIKKIVHGNMSAPYSSWDTTNTGSRALDAIAWIDQNAGVCEEYLIRVEKDEKLPRILLCRNSGVTIRLRGAANGEKTLSFNEIGDETLENTYMCPNPTESYSQQKTLGGFFQILNKGNVAIPFKLSLEKNITLKGYTPSPTMNTMRGMVALAGRGCVFIMLNGSKITGMNAKTPGYGAVHIYFDYETLTYQSRFWMFGGLITENQNDVLPINGKPAVINLDWVVYSPEGGHFVKKGGAITKNRNFLGVYDKDADSLSYTGLDNKAKLRWLGDGADFYFIPD
ncbi:MAG: hypothetical protein LBD07_01720, partial [Spirochaetaceae bacterium]|nr:hypothetical protein [Spirochaetaceae bacterium]